VLNCSGSGTVAQVVAGINWVTANSVNPAVANMSLGGGASTAIDNAVNSSINSGVTYAIAAGNSNANACGFSPARVPNAITVGATTQTDARASFSNFGSCLDVFAPGVGITSSWSTSNTATNTISGTSMATPHVAGVAALILSAHPAFTPAQVRTQLVNAATANVVTSPGSGSPNRLLFVSQTP
jgi:subtilisin family serine protease